MVVFSSLIRGSLLIGLCSAACSTIGERKAWHTLSNDEKDAYIDAELCLMSLPAKLNLSPARTRFDEFQAIHAFQAWATHFVGAFLPFHRAMLFAHETALREECGYKGWQPYWQEQLDAGKFAQSVVLSAEHGFGGGGSGTGNCITTGPFANYTNVLGPGYAHREHCIDRQIADFLSSSSSQRNVDNCLAQTTFEGAWNCIEGSPHVGGHGGVGGEMLNGVSSPGDPVFYLHHTWLDKIWADWQAKDPSTRLTAIGGANVMSTQSERMFNGGQSRPSGVPKPTGADGDPGTVTTLNHVLNMFGNGKNFTIGEVMDTSADPLCFKYVDPA